MRVVAIVLLRISMGLLMLLWGLDKLVNIEHALAVSEGFYFDLFTSAPVLQGFGVFQCALGLLLVLGWGRRLTHPVLIVITGVTLLGVWRSIVDPWGWYLEGSNVLFFPSLIIFSAALVLHAFRAEDRFSLDAMRGRSMP